MAIGVLFSSPPKATPSRLERAKDIGQGSFVLGYDLPKFFVHGVEFAKIPTREWRPMKELEVGDRIGLLMRRDIMQFTIFVNGKRKVSMNAQESKLDSQQRCSKDVWGILDVHGTIRSMQLRGPSDRHCLVPTPAPLLKSQETQDFDSDLPPTQEMKRPAPIPEQAQSGPHVEADEEMRRPSKRPRLTAHPCGCTIHLIRHDGKVVHVPGSDFVIGRSREGVNLTLDSKLFPNMVSRKHARILSSDAGVEIIDCESVNGTWVNNLKVNQRQMLKQDDSVVIGNPDEKFASAEFRFNISMPLST